MIQDGTGGFTAHDESFELNDESSGTGASSATA